MNILRFSFVTQIGLMTEKNVTLRLITNLQYSNTLDSLKSTRDLLCMHIHAYLLSTLEILFIILDTP